MGTIFAYSQNLHFYFAWGSWAEEMFILRFSQIPNGFRITIIHNRATWYLILFFCLLWVAWYSMSHGEHVNFISWGWLPCCILISLAPHTHRPTQPSFSPFSSHNSWGGINLWIRHLLTPFMSPAATGVAVSPLGVDMRFIGCLHRSVLSYKHSEKLLPSVGERLKITATKIGEWIKRQKEVYCPFHPKSKHTRPTIAAP